MEHALVPVHELSQARRPHNAICASYLATHSRVEAGLLRVHHQGDPHAMQMCGANRGLGVTTRDAERRKQNRNKNSDNPNNHHQFNEGKGAYLAPARHMTSLLGVGQTR
jgi:hypothetical protein